SEAPAGNVNGSRISSVVPPLVVAAPELLLPLAPWNRSVPDRSRTLPALVKMEPTVLVPPPADFRNIAPAWFSNVDVAPVMPASEPMSKLPSLWLRNAAALVIWRLLPESAHAPWFRSVRPLRMPPFTVQLTG